jgi:hypothetical protein
MTLPPVIMLFLPLAGYGLINNWPQKLLAALSPTFEQPATGDRLPVTDYNSDTPLAASHWIKDV